MFTKNKVVACANLPLSTVGLFLTASVVNLKFLAEDKSTNSYSESLACSSHTWVSSESWIRSWQVWKSPGLSKMFSEGSSLSGVSSLVFQDKLELIYYLAHNLNNYKVCTYLFSVCLPRWAELSWFQIGHSCSRLIVACFLA